jgi:hypothetical protein
MRDNKSEVDEQTRKITRERERAYYPSKSTYLGMN